MNVREHCTLEYYENDYRVHMEFVIIMSLQKINGCFDSLWLPYGFCLLCVSHSVNVRLLYCSALFRLIFMFQNNLLIDFLIDSRNDLLIDSQNDFLTIAC